MRVACTGLTSDLSNAANGMSRSVRLKCWLQPWTFLCQSCSRGGDERSGVCKERHAASDQATSCEFQTSERANFAREEFWGQHRYAVSEQGVRLNIKKVTLRHWRSEFARNLRRLGVPANATERAVRGQSRKAMTDGIYRASLRGDSTYIRAQAEAVAVELLNRNIRTEPGKRTMMVTRAAVEGGWRASANLLNQTGYRDLAVEVRRFVKEISPARTEREIVAAERMREVGASRTPEPVR